MKSNNKQVLLIAIIGATFIFGYGISHALNLSSGARLILFLPLEFIGFLIKLFIRKEDHQIILSLIFGGPFLIIYWFAVLQFIQRMIEKTVNRIKLK